MLFVDPTIMNEKYTQGFPIDMGKDNSVKTNTADSVFEYAKNTESYRMTKHGSFFMPDAVYQKPEGKENQTIVDQLDTQMDMSADNRKNQMIVMTNTASGEDLQKLAENGFSGFDTDSHTIVTVVDKIKIALAKAGVDISNMGGELSKEQLEEATGSSVIANQIMSILQGTDLPANQNNLVESQVAYETAEKLQPLSDSSKAYLVRNNYEPTIQNLYMSMFSGIEDDTVFQKAIDFSALEKQIEKIIQNAGLSITKETKEACKWLVERDISLTEKNLIYLNKLNSFSQEQFVEKSLDASYVMCKIAEAIKDGKRPMDALLIEGYSCMDKAEEAMQIIVNATDEDVAYCVSAEINISIENLKCAKGNRKETFTDISVEISADIRFVKAKRQLEETRLAMTVEANYALLKRGIAIDTKPLEQLVEDLRNQETQLYKDFLTQEKIEATEENTSVFVETTRFIEELKFHPAYVLQPEEEYTIRTLHQAGGQLKAAMESAVQKYEVLWTAPRADMGDSIQKAFRNVDDILMDLNLETSTFNQRAVRILAYNQTDITEENIVKVKEVDSQVQRLFKNLTPSVTLELIRRGENPLDVEISKLNEIAEQIQSDIGEKKEERFSKYLWKLEKNHKITEAERESYIGVYRLITQVEKTDGAVIGSLLNQGAELTMKNLLMAVRSSRKSVNYNIDDNFEGVKSTYKTNKIDEQILTSFQNNCIKDIADILSPEALSQIEDWEEQTPEHFLQELQQASKEEMSLQIEQQYYQEMATEYTSVLEASDDVYAFLEKYDVKNSAKNVLAIHRLFNNPSNVFEVLFSEENKSYDYKKRIAEMKEEILQRFGEAVKTPEEMAAAQDVLADVAERVMQTMIIENEPVSVKDIKDLRIMNQQIFLCAQKAKEESFLVPVETQGGVTGISLKIVRGKEDKGLVNIFFRGALMEKVAASFEANENGVSGVVATTDEETRKLLSDNLGLLAEKINGDGNEPLDVKVVSVSELSLWQFEKASLPEEGEKNQVQTKRLYHIAESFIQMISELYN